METYGPTVCLSLLGTERLEEDKLASLMFNVVDKNKELGLRQLRYDFHKMTQNDNFTAPLDHLMSKLENVILKEHVMWIKNKENP